MDFGDVEVGPDLLSNKLVLVCMKGIPRIFEPSEGIIGVDFKVGVIYEVEDGTSRLDDFRVGCVGDNTEEDLFHILVLVSGPLRDKGNPFLEMAKAWVPSHCLKSSVDLVFSTCEGLGNPFDEVVFENPLMELMEDIGGEGGKDVAEGEVRPEWIDRPKAIPAKRVWCIAICSEIESLDRKSVV